MESCASVPRIGAARKNNICRRSWTTQEEYVLLHALKELVVRGWKCDNGFKSGYQGILEQSMIQAFPGTDIRASPHINSKMHVWKKDYSSIYTMLSRSGFEWNDSTNILIVKEDPVWDEYVKTDSNAKGMRYKSWPYYKDWCEIFGKDRATGENAQGFADVIQDLLNAPSNRVPSVHELTPEVNRVSNNRERTPESQIPNDAAGHTSEVHADNGSTSKEKSAKKRKTSDDAHERFVGVIENFCEKTDARLGDLAKRIGFEQDAASSRKAVFDALDPMQFLSIQDKIAIATRLDNKTKDLDIFFSLSDENKAVMVKMMVDGKI